MSHPILSNRIASKQRAIISDTVATVHTLMELERKTWHAPLLYSAGLFVAFIPEYMTFKRWCTSQRKTEHNHRVSVLIVYVKSLVGGSSLQMFTSKQKTDITISKFHVHSREMTRNEGMTCNKGLQPNANKGTLWSVVCHSIYTLGRQCYINF